MHTPEAHLVFMCLIHEYLSAPPLARFGVVLFNEIRSPAVNPVSPVRGAAQWQETFT